MRRLKRNEEEKQEIEREKETRDDTVTAAHRIGECKSIFYFISSNRSVNVMNRYNISQIRYFKIDGLRLIFNLNYFITLFAGRYQCLLIFFL